MSVHSEYQQQILAELQAISEEQLQELLKIIRDYKLGTLSAKTEKKVTSLYGIWKDKISDDIEEPLQEIRTAWKKRLGDMNV